MVWASNTDGNRGARLVAENDGTMVICRTHATGTPALFGREAVWHSGGYDAAEHSVLVGRHASLQGRLGVVSLETLGGVFLDQPFVRQPLHGPERCPGIAKGVPGRDQLRVSLVKLVLEAPEGPLALQRSGAGARRHRGR